ncbi:MAG: RecQ family ATP-dependent DNA helicase [Planctomycetes bacterium]|nr:RecQ family ATP-dependent DNA helicase [Planctomycetota bacterium]
MQHHGSPPAKEQALSYLRDALADPAAQFRPGQWEAIRSLIEERGRQLVVQRTGWGKSLIYFLATRLLRDQRSGFTLLISPLLALMRNQIEMADRLGLEAASVNSTNQEDWASIQEAVLSDEVDVLLVSPERLANELFMKNTLLPVADRIGLFVIDEAHCISDWGHDFRPDYQRIRRVLQALPKNIPVLATTATANDRVVEDVRQQLGDGVGVQRGSLARDSLFLQNIWLPSQVARYGWLAEHLPTLPGSGIIYTLTRRDAHRVAGWLQECGIEAHAYMGGGEDNPDLEQRLLRNDIKALVATSALGMGFDKPDLTFVIHFQRPPSVVHYYQQVGRAGRALDRAFGIMLSGAEDREIGDYFINTAFPPEPEVEAVLKALRDARDGGITLRGIETAVNIGRGQVEKVLKLLAVEAPAPVVREGARWYATPVFYEVNHERISRLTQLRVAEQRRMEDYLKCDGCLMTFLQAELNDVSSELSACGHCASCDPEGALPDDVSDHFIQRAAAFLRRSEQPIEPRRTWAPAGDALECYGWHGTIPAELRAEEGRVLGHWSDAGWGELVRRGKETDGRFADELVTAARALVADRWAPDPFPTWVCAVPSLRHPGLVTDFAGRLAEALGLPYVACLKKVRETEPQKGMVNSYHQVRNIAGAFEVEEPLVRPAPVLLVDDVVDSRWTFTVISALLRGAGAGQVYPFALASTARM